MTSADAQIRAKTITTPLNPKIQVLKDVLKPDTTAHIRTKAALSAKSDTQTISVIRDADSTRPARRSLSSSDQAPKKRIALEQLRVVENGSSIAVSGSAASEHAAQKRLILAVVRAKPEMINLPAALQTEKAGKTATLLRQEVIVPGSKGNSVRVSALVSNRTGLTYVGARRRFEGRLNVALVYADGSPEDSLTRDVSIAVTALGAESIDPPEIRLREIGVWDEFKVAIRDPGDSCEVIVSAGAKDVGNSVMVPVKRPTINLVVSTPSVIGYGLGTFRVSVTSNGIHEAGGTMIGFKSRFAHFESVNPIVLDSNGAGTLRLRSTSSGFDTIETIEPFLNSPAKATVELKQPWTALLLAGIGGMIGAVVTGKRRRFLLGGLIGISLSILYFVGLDWVSKTTGFSSLAQAGEAVSFALGFLGSVVGVSWIKVGKSA